MSRFADEEIRRYGRQMVLPEVGGVGQARLRQTHAVATGEVEALYLAAAGIGILTVPTAEIAAAARALNPLVEVRISAGPVANDEVEVQALRALGIMREVLGL
jgi:molybdopterin/thiamine biosynthesis adenylyltransferase